MSEQLVRPGRVLFTPGWERDGWKKTGFGNNLGVRLLLERICGVPHNFLGEIEPDGRKTTLGLAPGEVGEYPQIYSLGNYLLPGVG